MRERQLRKKMIELGVSGEVLDRVEYDQGDQAGIKRLIGAIIARWP